MAVPGAKRVLVAVLVSLCASTAGAAQPQAPLPSSRIDFPVPVLLPADPGGSAERLIEVQRWTREYESWKAWFVRWHNRREPGWVKARPRRQPPQPPAWLPDACMAPLDDTGPLVDGCHAWREWERGDLALLLSSQVEQTRAELERPQKTSWWQRIHLDALWPMTQSGSTAFGVAGTHATVPVTDRVQVFLAPGAILMRLPTGDGSHTWTFGTDWGLSYRILDFRLPGMRRLSTLHLNIVRVWVLGTTPVPVTRELSLAGFSVTFKERPHPGAMK